MRLDSAYGKGHVRAGRGYLEQGDLYNARLQFRKALDLDSADKAAHKVRSSGVTRRLSRSQQSVHYMAVGSRARPHGYSPGAIALPQGMKDVDKAEAAEHSPASD